LQVVLAVVFALLASAASAEVKRYSVEGNRLYINTDIQFDIEDNNGISRQDVTEMRQTINMHPSIEVIVLTSSGCIGDAARKMARSIQDFGLDTEALGHCDSACAYIFLAGRHRTLLQGSLLGFHRSMITAQSVKNGPDPENPSPTVDATSVADAYDQGIDDGLDVVELMLKRGVSVDFALRVLRYPGSRIWYPPRNELLSAGVLIQP